MQSIRIILAVVALCALAHPLTQSATTATASACTMGEIPDARDRLDLRIENSSELVIVATVVRETPIKTDLITTSTGATVVKTLLDRPIYPPGYAEYQATLRVEAVLKGDLDEDELVLPSLYDEWACIGGPRLQEGTRYLLLLRQDSYWTSHGVPQDVFWSAGPVGGNIILADGTAYLDDYQSDWFGNGDLGSDVDSVRYVATKLDTSGEATASALATLGTTNPADDHGFDWALPAAALIVAAWTALVAVVFFRTRHARSR